MNQHLLVVFPHPDDEAFSVSGTLALQAQRGIPITYICLTLGEMGRNMGIPPFATRESLPEIRKKELLASCQAIGITDVRMWGLRDKTIEFIPREELASRIQEVIKEIQPHLMITHYPGYSIHPDHEACGAAAIQAVESLPPEKRPLIQAIAFSNDCLEKLGEPDIVHDVSRVLEQKLQAIRAHRSQTGDILPEMEKKLAQNDPEMVARVKKERFWTYTCKPTSS